MGLFIGFLSKQPFLALFLVIATIIKILIALIIILLGSAT